MSYEGKGVNYNGKGVNYNGKCVSYNGKGVIYEGKCIRRSTFRAEGLLPSQPVYNHRKLPVSYPGGGGAGGSLAVYTLGKQVTMLLEVTVM